MEFFVLVSLLVTFVSSNPVCQPSNDCHVSNGTLRCTNWNSSQVLFIKDCPNLQIKSLDLSGNNISRVVEASGQMNLSLRGFGDPDLQEVEIDTQLLAVLERIDLSHNQLQSFPSKLTNIPALKELDLSFNKIKKLNSNFKMDALVFLNLGNNKFEKLEDNFFEKYPNLQKLDLSGNGLKTLKNLKLKDVKVLNISNNLIHNIEPNTFKDSPKLEILDLSKNSQTQIDKSIFTGIQMSLRQLDLSRNNLTRVDSDAFSELEQLKKLSLSQNQLVNIDDIFFPYHLRILELNKNSLQDPDDCSFQHLMDIEHLDLGDNLLSCNCHLYSIFKFFGSRLYTNQNSTCRNATDENSEVPINSLEMRCSNQGCMSHSAVSENYPKLNLTIKIDETLVKISWRSSLDTQLFHLQINDSSNKEILSKYITYDRQYEFESSSVFASNHICIAALNDHKEILHRVCDVARISNKNIIIGILAGTMALIPCVVLMIYIVNKDKRYREKELVEKVLVKPVQGKKSIPDEAAHGNGVNPGFEPDNPKCDPKTVPQATFSTEDAKAQQSSTNL